MTPTPQSPQSAKCHACGRNNIALTPNGRLALHAITENEEDFTCRGSQCIPDASLQPEREGGAAVVGGAPFTIPVAPDTQAGTPLTDIETKKQWEGMGQSSWVPAYFARTLERRALAVEADVKRIEKVMRVLQIGKNDEVITAYDDVGTPKALLPRDDLHGRRHGLRHQARRHDRHFLREVIYETPIHSQRTAQDN